MKIGLIIVVILLIVALMLGSSYVGRRNQMAVKREAVSESWAQVDVVLQRRADRSESEFRFQQVHRAGEACSGARETVI